MLFFLIKCKDLNIVPLFAVFVAKPIWPHARKKQKTQHGKKIQHVSIKKFRGESSERLKERLDDALGRHDMLYRHNDGQMAGRDLENKTNQRKNREKHELHNAIQRGRHTHRGQT